MNTPTEAQWIAELIGAGPVTVLVVVILVLLRAHFRRMEHREQRTGDAILAFVEVLSRLEVRIEGRPEVTGDPRAATPPRGVSVSIRQRRGRRPQDTDPEEGG